MLDFLASLGATVNLPYTVPLVLVFMLAALHLVGLGLEGILGAAGLDVDVSHDMDGHHDLDLHIHHGLLVSGLGFFHLGKVPLGFIVQLLLIFFALTGLATNKLVVPEWWPGAGAATALAVSLPIAAAASILFTKAVAATLARVAPGGGTGAVPLRALAGQGGTAVSATVDGTQGRAEVRDREGEPHDVFCRMLPGEPALRKGDPVLLVQYEAAENFFRASAAPVGVQ